MEFAFRAGERRPRSPSPDDRRRFAPPQAGPFHGEPPPPPPSPLEWEAAARRERIIREEVERRLIEAEVRRELACFHGGFGPFAPPMPPPQMPAGMHPNCPPPALFGSSRDGFGSGPRRLPGFGQSVLPSETRTRPLPPPEPRHQLQLREIAFNKNSEVLSSETKVAGVKRKADASSATTKPTKQQNASSATGPTQAQTAAKDWSCALCQVSATSEAGLNQHLEGKKHKAKLVQYGAIKAVDTNKSGLEVTTGNNNGAGPSDTHKKINILVDGELHQVVEKSNCVWCERCRVSCTNAAAMADHLRGKKHSLLNKVWRQIKAVRMNKEVKEDSAAACERGVNQNRPTGIPYMTSEFSGDGSFEIPMEMKETNMVEEVDPNSHNVIPAEIKEEDTDTATEVNRNCAGETKQEGTDVDVVMDVNKSFLLKVHQKPRNKANKNFLSKFHQKSRKRANKKFLFKVHHNSRKKANKNFQFKVYQKSGNKANKWFRIQEVNETSSIEILAKPQRQPTDSIVHPREEE